ncbi:MAG: bifunctional (p)ppGpp synthetase/guanosine-3',5'-bis(diphosphate) 3'-pyrophosphohydrolase [Actinobacteria bacterium]|nr:bifunctional (p)ppGpp synthetase/guanosine-3',5'-bis(diphosphate) 3'-pyrophosphohydrolase [Actinomycetota bacterium]
MSSQLISPLLSIIDANKKERAEIERAYETAEKAHLGQNRKSGEEYISHPVAVAQILAELGMGSSTIIAALLHDTVEDTSYSIEQLRIDFGDEVADLVDGVTKLDRVTYGPDAEAETVRKMVVAMSKDIRVLVIKLADRLHNARTWEFLTPETATRKARETLDIYAPLSHRLGMSTIKWELEDISFRTLEPKKYEEIGRLVVDRESIRGEYATEVIAEIKRELKEAEIKADVTGRYKHYYSIYQKMVMRGREFNEIYDLTGVRVLVEDVKDCYGALGAIHAHWNPVPGRFKDYIAMPKFNLYQSLHTTVIGPEGKAVEIQIRTKDMHARAEFGIAAHWKYKKGKSNNELEGANNDANMAWLKQLHEWQQETKDAEEFLESLRFDLGTPEVFIFTPKGSVLALPSGSTPVDFAYAVHTEVGRRCIGAKVNGKLVTLGTPLVNGDVVEILTNKAETAGPSHDWLNFVKSPRARSKIKAWFSKERRDEAIDAGKESIARQLRKQDLPLQKILTSHALLELAHEMKYLDITSLYAAVGDGHVSAASIVEKLISSLGTDEHEHEHNDHNFLLENPSSTTNRRNAGVDVVGAKDLLVKLARCCAPVPGDEIVGFITKASGVSIHRVDCTNVDDLQRTQPERFLPVSWTPGAVTLFLVNIQVEALDRARLLSDITKMLSDSQVNILSASVTTTRDRVAISRFTFEMADATHLEDVLRAVRTVDGVYDVYRITNN